ncbi:hypothetical protein BDV19DRAFT_81278 [Aspergillus venezuelensis]
MGNICSSSKNRPSSSGDEVFSRPGRVLGSSANAAPRASVPASAKSKSHFSSPGRTLGGSGSGSGGDGGAGTTDASATAGSGAGTETGTGTVDEAGSSADDARARAALAAQKRAETGNAGKGKLGTKLAAQKAQTHAQTLNEASRDERAARDADDASAARRWE